MKTRKLGQALSFALRITLPTLAVAGPLVAVSVGLTACDDENDPKTWVKRLDDPAQRSAAVKRLGEFYEDAMSRSGKKPDSPEVKAVLDVAVEPLTKTYTAGNLDEKTRKDLMKTLSDMKDKRASPAFAKAFNEYESGMDDDVKYAAEAVGWLADHGTKLDQTVIDALWKCFTKFTPTKSHSIQATHAIHDAVLAVKDPSYGPKAVAMLAAPVVLTDQPVNDQLDFWQMTAVQTISALKFAPACKALVTVIMTKNKLKLANAAKTALLKMPKASVPILAAALSGSDPDFAKLYPEWGEEKGYVILLVDILSYSSVEAAKDAIVAAIPSLDNDTNRAAVAQSLIWFPHDPKLVEDFKELYAKLPPITDKGGETTGRERSGLLQVSSEFNDPSLIPWMLKEGSAAKGDFVIAAKLNAIQAATKVMQPDQKKMVGAALSALESTSMSKDEKSAVANLRDAYDRAAGVLDQCKKDAACYVKVLDEPVPSSPPTANWKAIKAAAMAGMIGDDATRKALVAKIGKVENPGARLAVSVAIDELAPKGDVAAADALDKVVEADTKSNANKADDALVKVSLRLRARAGQ